MSKIGHSIINLTITLAVGQGFIQESDWLPEGFFQPLTLGPLWTAVDATQLEGAKRIYYGIVGWDENPGIRSIEAFAHLVLRLENAPNGRVDGYLPVPMSYR